jgi:hypothetical protein
MCDWNSDSHGICYRAHLFPDTISRPQKWKFWRLVIPSPVHAFPTFLPHILNVVSSTRSNLLETISMTIISASGGQTRPKEPRFRCCCSELTKFAITISLCAKCMNERIPHFVWNTFPFELYVHKHRVLLKSSPTFLVSVDRKKAPLGLRQNWWWVV